MMVAFARVQAPQSNLISLLRPPNAEEDQSWYGNKRLAELMAVERAERAAKGTEYV